jgi:tetratricopeptide (TPR) repeat protein
MLFRARFSGILRLHQDAVSRVVEMLEGKPARVRTGSAAESLCARLVRGGKLSSDDAARVSALASSKDIAEEKALITLRLLGPRDLFLAIRDHERALLLDCFAWSDGAFELDPRAAIAPEASAFAQDPVALAHAGVAAHWSAERALATLGNAASRFAVPGPGFEEARTALRGASGFDALTAALDGKTRLGMAANTAADPGAFAAAVVLDTLGVLSYHDEPQVRDTPVPEAPPPAEQCTEPVIEIVVSAGDEGRVVASATDAAPTPTASTQTEHEALRRTLLEKHAQLERLDYYALLGVPRNADTAAIRRAYVAAAKIYHPDALLRSGLEDLRTEANAVFARVSKAHSTLSDPAARREYDEAGDGITDDDVQRLASAEGSYRKGEILLRKGSFDDALRFLRPAVELCDDEPDYRSALGWALFKKSASEPDAARAELEQATKLDPKNATAHHRLSLVLRALGKGKEAAECLAKARALDPRAGQGRS